MSWIIGLTKEQAQDRCDKESLAHKLPKPGIPEAPYPYGWTINWVEPQKHPKKDEWAVSLWQSLIPIPEESIVCENLPDDWALTIGDLT